MRPGPGHIVVIDPAMHTPELASLNRLALVSPLPLTYHLPALFGLGSLRAESISDIRGLLILGSASSVHDRLPWQKELEDWLRPVLLAGIPTLGICYGHQMIAHMFGGRIDFAWEDHHKAVGKRWVDLDKTPIWQASQGEVVVSHCETVVEAPPSFCVVGRSKEVQVEALQHQSLPIWSLQSHPEATSRFLASQGVTLQAEDLLFGHNVVQGFITYAWAKATET